MSSKYLIKVLILLKEIYPTIIWKETNLFNLVQGAHISHELSQLIKDWNANLKKMRVDLYVKGQVAIEVHGEQHDRPVKFSNSILDIDEQLKKRKALDDIKTRALLEAGIPFVTIWHHELKDDFLTVEKLRDRIRQAQELADSIPVQRRQNVKLPQFRTRQESFESKSKRLKKGREQRRKAYLFKKALKANRGK